MRKFWKDLKRTLALYVVALVPLTIVALVVIGVWGEEVGYKVTPFLGLLSGLWIICYERKHKYWEKQDQENPTSKDN